jgi:hypothetical protein
VKGRGKGGGEGWDERGRGEGWDGEGREEERRWGDGMER